MNYTQLYFKLKENLSFDGFSLDSFESDSLFENYCNFQLHDGSRVIVSKELLESINKMNINKQLLESYMKTNSDNFLRIIKECIEIK